MNCKYSVNNKQYIQEKKNKLSAVLNFEPNIPKNKNIKYHIIIKMKGGYLVNISMYSFTFIN